MFLDPDRLLEAQPAEVLDAAARGRLGLDHRFLHALIDRPDESIPAVVAFGQRDRSHDLVDLALELIALIRHWHTPAGVAFLVQYIREDPDEIPDEVVVALVESAAAALEPLLALYGELDETEGGEVAFILANLRIRDERILSLLLDRLDYDLSDTLLLLGIYGDPAARPAIEEALATLGEDDAELKKEGAETLALLSAGSQPKEVLDAQPFDIWDLYPETAELPVDLLSEDDRFELLNYPIAGVRAAAVRSFFNRPLNPEQRRQLLTMAQADSSVEVRARAWETMIEATEESEVVEAMLKALRNPNLPVEERGGLLVGLAPETDRNEVRKAIVDLYAVPAGRAKALESMWRSMHASFRDYFAKHLDDPDSDVRRSALWGVGYYGIKSELEKVRKMFDDDELRSDALFAYALAIPGEVSRGRMKSLLARVEKDAHGLSEMEEELVKAALDERLLLAGKEPVFHQPEG